MLQVVSWLNLGVWLAYAVGAWPILTITGRRHVLARGILEISLLLFLQALILVDWAYTEPGAGRYMAARYAVRFLSLGTAIVIGLTLWRIMTRKEED